MTASVESQECGTERPPKASGCHVRTCRIHDCGDAIPPPWEKKMASPLDDSPSPSPNRPKGPRCMAWAGAPSGTKDPFPDIGHMMWLQELAHSGKRALHLSGVVGAVTTLFCLVQPFCTLTHTLLHVVFLLLYVLLQASSNVCRSSR